MLDLAARLAPAGAARRRHAARLPQPCAAHRARRPRTRARACRLDREPRSIPRMARRGRERRANSRPCSARRPLADCACGASRRCASAALRSSTRRIVKRYRGVTREWLRQTNTHRPCFRAHCAKDTLSRANARCAACPAGVRKRAKFVAWQHRRNVRELTGVRGAIPCRALSFLRFPPTSSIASIARRNDSLGAPRPLGGFRNARRCSVSLLAWRLPCAGAWPVLPYSVARDRGAGGCVRVHRAPRGDWERMTVAGRSRGRRTARQAAGDERREFNRYWVRVECRDARMSRAAAADAAFAAGRRARSAMRCRRSSACAMAKDLRAAARRRDRPVDDRREAVEGQFEDQHGSQAQGRASNIRSGRHRITGVGGSCGERVASARHSRTRRSNGTCSRRSRRSRSRSTTCTRASSGSASSSSSSCSA